MADNNNRKKKKESTEDERKMAKRWRKEGKTNKEIATLLGRTTRWVQRWCNRPDLCGVKDRRRSGIDFIDFNGKPVCQMSLTTRGRIISSKVLFQVSLMLPN